MMFAFSGKILNKYEVSYFQCQQCGFLQTEEPYWLDEAYTSAITIADTGLTQRNISIASKLAVLIYFEFESTSSYLDIAGGYGMLARLMRDYGFDFFWSDKHCQNLLARGFESEKAINPFYALTAFEVLEHIHDPLKFIRDMMNNNNSRTLIFTTGLYEGPPPSKEWWYYVFETGQHISFYQKRTLQYIAERLGLRLYSAHGTHVITDKYINIFRFNILTSRLADVLAFYVKLRMPSLRIPDHYKLIKDDLLSNEVKE